MALGISFGKNKTKTNSTTKVDKTENTSGTQQTTGVKGATQTQQGTSQSTGTQQQTGSTSQVGTNAQTGTTTQQQQQTSSLFGGEVLAGLEGAVNDLLKSTGGAALAPGQVDDFDSEKFIAGGMAAATARQESLLDEMFGGLGDSIGGTVGSNSMQALLAQRGVSDANANLAGTQSELAKTAAQIEASNLQANTGAQGQSQGFLTQLLGALKGGQQTTTGTATGTETQAGTQTQTGTSQQNTSQQQSEQTSQVSNLIELISQLVNTDQMTHTVGTEKTKGSQSKAGGGFGLSL